MRPDLRHTVGMKRGSLLNRRLDHWIGIPVLYGLTVLRRPRPTPRRAPERIGVICSPALGDTLLFSGALRDLRAAFPAAHITHICTKQNLAAAEIIPGADAQVLVRLTEPLQTCRRLRAQRFDVLFDFTSWQRLTAFYTWLAGAGYTVGFATPGQARSGGYDCTAPHGHDRHEIENFRRLLRASGVVPPESIGHDPGVVLPAMEQTELPFAEEADLVVLHPWASGQRSTLREWPEERWVELACRLAKPGTLFLVTGGPGDRRRTTPLLAQLLAAGLRAEAFISPDGFRTLAHLLLRSRVVVTVNTGVMHLAAIAGARTVAINGPNRNSRWGPIGPRAIGVEAPGPGCGFLHLGFNFDGNPVDCMERITVDMVAQAAELLTMPLWPARYVSRPGVPRRAHVDAGRVLEEVV